jgi:hypothetical protein
MNEEKIKEVRVMGYKITKQSNNTAHDVYDLVVDTVADLDTLPKYIGAGSTVVILENDENAVEVRMKNLNGEWKVI